MTMVIYHGGCPDGFAAAYYAQLAYGGTAEMVPGYYGAPPPDVTDRDVLVVDFSYPRATLVEMCAKARSLRVYDHHKTAQADLEGLDFCTFDMERSGAGITFDELIGGTRPWLVDYVEDRDLWRWKLPRSREISNAIMATPYSLEAWDELLRRGKDAAAQDGAAIGRKIDAYCSAMEANAYWTEIDGHECPIVNAPQVMISDLLHHLCTLMQKRRGTTDPVMAAGWWVRADGQYQYSLRSIGDIDVSTIATVHGGGGHKNAAGFTRTTPLPHERGAPWSAG